MGLKKPHRQYRRLVSIKKRWISTVGIGDMSVRSRVV